MWVYLVNVVQKRQLLCSAYLLFDLDRDIITIYEGCQKSCQFKFLSEERLQIEDIS